MSTDDAIDQLDAEVQALEWLAAKGYQNAALLHAYPLRAEQGWGFVYDPHGDGDYIEDGLLIPGATGALVVTADGVESMYTTEFAKRTADESVPLEIGPFGYYTHDRNVGWLVRFRTMEGGAWFWRPERREWERYSWAPWGTVQDWSPIPEAEARATYPEAFAGRRTLEVFRGEPLTRKQRALAMGERVGDPYVATRGKVPPDDKPVR